MRVAQHTKISGGLNLIANKLSIKNQVNITNLTHDKNGRFLLYILNNESLQSHKEVLRDIFTTLMNDEKFKNFGVNKVIIITALINGEEFSFHHNILINNTTTFEEYYNEIKDIISTNYQDGYPVDVIPEFKVKV
jgi:hypothetical protein